MTDQYLILADDRLQQRKTKNKTDGNFDNFKTTKQRSLTTHSLHPPADQLLYFLVPFSIPILALRMKKKKKGAPHKTHHNQQRGHACTQLNTAVNNGLLQQIAPPLFFLLKSPPATDRRCRRINYLFTAWQGAAVFLQPPDKHQHQAPSSQHTWPLAARSKVQHFTEV